jgi:hypothetical protein
LPSRGPNASGQHARWLLRRFDAATATLRAALSDVTPPPGEPGEADTDASAQGRKASGSLGGAAGAGQKACPICSAAIKREGGFDFHALGRQPIYFDRIECVLAYMRRTFSARWREADEDFVKRAGSLSGAAGAVDE